jgi:hypothetical protein
VSPNLSPLLGTVLVAMIVAGGCLGGAGDAGDPSAAVASPVIYDEDGRVEVFAHPDPGVRRLALESVAALVFGNRVGMGLTGPTLDTVSLADRLGTCSGEPFGDQPTLGRCSAVLVDSDLVLTAGHCLGDSPAAAAELCRDSLVLFGFAYAAGPELAATEAKDVHACRRVVAHRYDATEEAGEDFAVLQLDRPAEGRAPVPIADVPSPGASLHLVGNGAGLPTKIDSGGKVVEAPDGDGASHFFARTDSFEAGSGSGLFDVALRLVGIQSRGAADWELAATSGCVVSAHAADGFEVHQRAARAIEQLCRAGWPSERLCGVAPRCGDGACAAGESSSGCREDCAPGGCGDGVCTLDERAMCADCARLARLPAGWRCAPRDYASGERCDCKCGAPDPDCAAPTLPVKGCDWGMICGAEGACTPGRGRADATSGGPEDQGGGPQCTIAPRRAGQPPAGRLPLLLLAILVAVFRLNAQSVSRPGPAREPQHLPRGTS